MTEAESEKVRGIRNAAGEHVAYVAKLAHWEAVRALMTNPHVPPVPHPRPPSDGDSFRRVYGLWLETESE